MSGLDSYAVSRTHATDRFYNPPAVRRQQQQQQLLLQQQQQQQQLRHRNGGGAEADNPQSDNFPTLPETDAGNVTNLDRFMESVTPSVLAQFSPQAKIRSWRGREPELHLCYGLGDLWDSFGEWSVYGVGVPLVLNGQESVVQYYVPFLSGLQLYVDPEKTPSRCRRPGEESNVQSSRETSSGGSSDCEVDKRSGSQQSNLNSLRKIGVLSSSGDEAESGHSPGTLVFEYMEREAPHNRKPLADKISALASQFPDLRKYKSCDLLPSSWISVAWYPIYRIPVGPTLKDLDASFLTFHSLSTKSTNNGQLRSYGAGGKKTVSGVDAALKVPLPVFGLASYKLKGSILSPFGPPECQQENSLLQAADSWLSNLQAIHPDYQFFLHHYSHWR